MRCERQREVEAWVLGELDDARTAEARAHVAACADCAEEARWLSAERQVFAQRSALAAPAPPPFAAVMARARREGDEGTRPARRAWVGAALAAAAALVVFVTGAVPRGPHGEAAPEIAADPPMELSCFEGQPVAVEREAFVTDRAIATVEDQYDACLLATPLARPSRGPRACAPPVDRAVTCDPLGPLPGEAVE
jgi:anti-sigma factor RsiW